MRTIRFKVKAGDHVVGDLLKILEEAMREGRVYNVSIQVEEVEA